MNQINYTVITGASMGLGKAFAYECARRHMNLILISLKDEGINRLTAKLSEKFKIKALGYEVDLTKVDSLHRLVQFINGNFQVGFLINNAGFGGSNYFEGATIDYLERLIQLNIKSLTFLTHQLLPNLKRQHKSYILNIASLASFKPMPFKTVYPASKAFVSSFSRGLNAELKESCISVSVAHPGGMATNVEVTERINKHHRLIQATILSPKEVAKLCIAATLRRKEVIIPGFANKVSYLFLMLCPYNLRMKLFKKSIQKEIVAVQ